MTVAYHLETHRNRAQVERLVRRLRDEDPSCVVVVNHDERGEPLDLATMARLDAVVLAGTGGYSDLSHARRWLQTVQWLSDHDVEYDWLSNLSGQCYPIRPLRDVNAELSATRTDAFVETFDTADAAESTWGTDLARTRYFFSHRRLRPLTERQMWVLRPLQAVNRVQPWLRLTTATGLTVGRRVRPTPFDDGSLVLRGGSFFTTLRHPAVEHVVRFTHDRRDVMRHLSGCLAPAEVFFQTALGTSTSLAVVNDCRRYFDFSHTKFNRPKTLGLPDLPAVVASGKDFARKLDLSRDPELFERIDAHVAAVSSSASHH